MTDKWQLWLDRKERVIGVAVVHRASDSALRVERRGLDDRDHRDYCARLCEVLNKARMP